jgi:hypothetical protein
LIQVFLSLFFFQFVTEVALGFPLGRDISVHRVVAREFGGRVTAKTGRIVLLPALVVRIPGHSRGCALGSQEKENQNPPAESEEEDSLKLFTHGPLYIASRGRSRKAGRFFAKTGIVVVD